jgi:hypothetical protein
MTARIDSEESAGSLRAASETRRAFVERLARTSAIPLVLPLLLSSAKVAVAYV